MTALYKQGTTATINPIYNLFSKIADVALEDASGIPEDIYDAKINDALSSIPEMLAFLGKHPYFKNTPIVKNIGINATLQADLTDKLNFKKWKNPSNIKKMGKDWLIGKFIDHTSQAIGNATGSKKWEGVSWFIIKQMYSVGTAYSESKGNPAMFQINLLINQSGLLADVISKNIEELNILQNDFTGAKAAEIRNQIIQARSFQLLDRYQNYFRAATWKEKNAIRKDIELKQSDLLKRYLSGDADHIFVPRVSIIAKKIYAAWLKDLPGDLVKEELEYKANLSASVYKGEYDQAISAAKSIFGSSTFADDLIREKAKTDAGAMAYLVANGITP